MVRSRAHGALATGYGCPCLDSTIFERSARLVVACATRASVVYWPTHTSSPPRWAESCFWSCITARGASRMSHRLRLTVVMLLVLVALPMVPGSPLRVRPVLADGVTYGEFSNRTTILVPPSPNGYTPSSTESSIAVSGLC